MPPSGVLFLLNIQTFYNNATTPWFNKLVNWFRYNNKFRTEETKPLKDGILIEIKFSTGETKPGRVT